MMTRLLLLVALSLAAAQPGPSGPGVLRGRVFDGRTGVPLPEASVLLRRETGEVDQSTTDGEGGYEFRAVAPGRYTVSASKDGYSSVAYSARPPIPDETPIQVGEGADVAGIDIVLERSCAVSGRVIDEFGEPVSRATVVAEVRYEDDEKLRRLFNAGETITDDLGRFRMSDLGAGKYFIAVEPPELVLRGTGELDDIEDEEPAKSAPVYFPGVTDPAAATPVRPKPGQDFTVTIALKPPVRTARLSGMVVDEQGRPPKPGTNVYVASRSSPSARSLGYFPVRADGRFTVFGLIPGQYDLSAELWDPDGKGLARGAARVTVSGGDRSGVVLKMTRGGTVSGRVVFEGTSPPPPDKLAIHVHEVRWFSSGRSLTETSVASDGTFTLTPIFDECLIGLSGAPGWTLKTVTVNGRDVTDTPLLVNGGQTIPGATIVMTDSLTRVNIAVRPPGGQPADSAYLVIYPDDPSKWPPFWSRYRRERWVHDASAVTFEGLPPGDYFAFALTPRAALADTANKSPRVLLERMRRIATRFTLRKGETKDLALTPVGPGGK
jgi:protocatechuate 3,4-dioxygenase beta subunit